MNEQTLARRELKDVWVIVPYPNMKPKETLQMLIDNFVFETEQLAKDEAAKAVKQDHDSFWGYTTQRKSLVLAKETILTMSAFRFAVRATKPLGWELFRKRVLDANTHERDEVTDEDIAGLYADYFKSGKTFEQWKTEK